MKSEILEFDGIKDKLAKRFIAFDTETTGLSAAKNRIIELGAVVFENGEPVRRFDSFVHSVPYIPRFITGLTGISFDMLADAPSEMEIYPIFADFLGDALTGDTLMCAHNASFDIRFIEAAFERNNISCNLKFADTLKTAKSKLSLPNYKQDTVADYFGIINKHAHRAEADAETCGRIMVNLLGI